MVGWVDVRKDFAVFVEWAEKYSDAQPRDAKGRFARTQGTGIVGDATRNTRNVDNPHGQPLEGRPLRKNIIDAIVRGASMSPDTERRFGPMSTPASKGTLIRITKVAEQLAQTYGHFFPDIKRTKLSVREKTEGASCAVKISKNTKEHEVVLLLSARDKGDGKGKHIQEETIKHELLHAMVGHSVAPSPQSLGRAIVRHAYPTAHGAAAPPPVGTPQHHWKVAHEFIAQYGTIFDPKKHMKGGSVDIEAFTKDCVSAQTS